MIEDEDAYDLNIPLIVNNRSNGCLRVKLHFTYTGRQVPMLDYLGKPSKALPYRIDTGDLLLITNNNVPSFFGRVFTWSDWDHGSSFELNVMWLFSHSLIIALVAVVIRKNVKTGKQEDEEKLCILEATLQVQR